MTVFERILSLVYTDCPRVPGLLPVDRGRLPDSSSVRPFPRPSSSRSARGGLARCGIVSPRLGPSAAALLVAPLLVRAAASFLLPASRPRFNGSPGGSNGCPLLELRGRSEMFQKFPFLLLGLVPCLRDCFRANGLHQRSRALFLLSHPRYSNFKRSQSVSISHQITRSLTSQSATIKNRIEGPLGVLGVPLAQTPRPLCQHVLLLMLTSP